MERNIKLSVLLGIWGSLQFHQPVFALFYTLSKGFTLQQFFYCLSTYFLASLLAEIPTGSYSDRVSRRRSLIIAWVVGTSATLTMLLTQSFWVMLLANAVAGVGSAFASGTDNALLYDSLVTLKRQKEFKALSGRMGWYGGLAMAFSAALGGFVAQWDITYAWWVGFVVGSASIVPLLLLQEPPIARADTKEESYVTHLKDSMRRGLQGDAGYFVWYAVGVWFFFSIGFWLWQPYLKLIELPLAWFGLLYAAMNIVGGFASKHADLLEKRLGMRRSLLVIPLLLAAAFVLESRIVLWFSFVFIAVQSVSSGFFSTVLNDYINARIPSERRATILSFKNGLNSLLFCVLSPLVGYHVDVFSLQTTLLLLAAALTVTTIVLWCFLPRASRLES